MKFRSALKSDMETLKSLIIEHATELNKKHEMTLSTEDLIHHGFDREPPTFECHLAHLEDGEIVGYAIYFDVYSTWDGNATMVEDFYVRPEHRDVGGVHGMIDALLKHALSTGHTRLEFNAFEDDPMAAFHVSRGAMNLADSNLAVDYTFDGKVYRENERWLSYRITNPVMRELAEENLEKSL